MSVQLPTPNTAENEFSQAGDIFANLATFSPAEIFWRDKLDLMDRSRSQTWWIHPLLTRWNKSSRATTFVRMAPRQLTKHTLEPAPSDELLSEHFFVYFPYRVLISVFCPSDGSARIFFILPPYAMAGNQTHISLVSRGTLIRDALATELPRPRPIVQTVS